MVMSAGISVAWRAEGDMRAIYIPLRHPDSDCFDPAQVYRWLADLVASKTRIATLNGVYDLGWLRADGGIAMPPSDRLEEIGALATTVNENLFRYSLDALCGTYGLPGKDEILLREAVEAAGFAPRPKEGQHPRNISGSCRRATSASMPRPTRSTRSHCMKS